MSAVERYYWRRLSPRPARKPDHPSDLCPICVHLNKWFGDSPVRQATHGAGDPDGQWRSCYEHYRVLSAFQIIGLTKDPAS